MLLPVNVNADNRIESIQKRFMRYILYLVILNIQNMHFMLLNFDLFQNGIDAPVLLSSLSWSVPSRCLCDGHMFRVPVTNYGVFDEHITNMSIMMNELQKIFKYHVSSSSFRKSTHVE